MKDKLIIHNYTNLSDLEVMEYVMNVIKNGYMSETEKEGLQYCFVTTFKSLITVCASKKGNTHTFKVIEENN